MLRWDACELVKHRSCEWMSTLGRGEPGVPWNFLWLGFRSVGCAVAMRGSNGRVDPWVAWHALRQRGATCGLRCTQVTSQEGEEGDPSLGDGCSMRTSVKLQCCWRVRRCWHDVAASCVCPDAHVVHMHVFAACILSSVQGSSPVASMKGWLMGWARQKRTPCNIVRNQGHTEGNLVASGHCGRRSQADELANRQGHGRR